MHLPNLIRDRFVTALSELTDSPLEFASMIRGTTDTRFGDYQSNCAMPLAKSPACALTNPREVAAKVIASVSLDDICEPPEIAGPGFINLTLKTSFLAEQLKRMMDDERCLVAPAESPQTVIIDYSSPNVAKPMHVGHIRSTVIGDALAHVFRFLKHNVITDNHLGDWGTQFGIIIYGYRHFGDPEIVAKAPVAELSKLYRLVHQLMEAEKSAASIAGLVEASGRLEGEIKQLETTIASLDEKSAKKEAKSLAGLQRKLQANEEAIASAKEKVAAVESDPEMKARSLAHPGIASAVLRETAKLHEGDEENIRLWREFLPHCKDEIERVYKRLKVSFDHTLGESFYHSMLADTVSDLQSRGLARDSDGAVCVFLDAFDAPMIIRKQDGAFLYATTDLATLKYRLEEFAPNQILYVVDTRQSEHFEKLFAVAKLMGLDSVRLAHVNFGTVLGEDGRPMKTRSGSLIGLESLLDDAVSRARDVVCDPERLARMSPPMDLEEQNAVAEAVGIGAIKYADLSHHRTSDYRFSLEKMVALDGNTAAYIQYSYARTQSILRRSEISIEELASQVREQGIQIGEPAERQLAISLLKFEEALKAVEQDYSPNLLVDYLYDTAKAYSVFNDSCVVLKAETETLIRSRLALVALSGRVLRLGLSLLGIDVPDRM